MNIQKRKSHQLDPKTASYLFSSSARVRHVRKLPSIDDRSLIASPLDSFKQPTYVLEQAIYLAQDVESIKKELVPLRQQYESIRSTIDYTDTTLEDVDPYDEISRREGYSRLHRLQDESRELDSQVSLLNTTFVDESRNTLNAYVTEQYQMKAQIDIDLNDLREAINLQKNELENRVNSEIKDKILENDKKIKELKRVLSQLSSDEKQLLEEHQIVFSTRPKKEKLTLIQSSLQKQLSSLQHQSSQKRVELAKIQKSQKQQKKDIHDVIEEQKVKENQEKASERYRRIYQKKVEEMKKQSDEEKEREKEYLENLVNFYREEETETMLVKTKIKRRHKHFHQRKEDASEIENENEKVPNNEKEQNIENQNLDKSSVSPNESENHYSVIEHANANGASCVMMNEEEAVNSVEPSNENYVNQMSDENVNEILMKNLENLEMGIHS
ncbi:hypothetical protein M9Y10_004853 [Tritrichomonas musculus]|uniref:DUF4709 domain-containing protein n=1 Tax=Tritrichomonas musculus TaxID=1915356 RepID=A0ABR2JJP2_9EUKA